MGKSLYRRRRRASTARIRHRPHRHRPAGRCPAGCYGRILRALRSGGQLPRAGRQATAAAQLGSAEHTGGAMTDPLASTPVPQRSGAGSRRRTRCGEPSRAGVEPALQRPRGFTTAGHCAHTARLSAQRSPPRDPRRPELVRPLAAEAVAGLVAETVAAEQGPGLLARVSGAAGNPLFVTELVGALVQEGAVETAGDGRKRRADAAADAAADNLAPAQFPV